MDIRRLRKIEWLIPIAAIILCVIGLVALYSASYDTNLEEFKKNYPNVEVIPISAFNMEGIDEMIERLMEILKETPKEELYPQESFKVYKYEDNVPYKIKKDGNIWVVSGKEIETLLLMTKFNEDEGVLRFARKFKGMGIEDELEKMGAKVGDEVQILDYMFTFKG